MKNKRFSSLLESVGRPSFAWNRLLLVAIVAGLIGACTTTKSDSVGDVDEAFARASYDKEREQTEEALRAVENSAAESALDQVIKRDYYLPPAMLKSLSKRAIAAREKIKSQPSADLDSLRILATESLVNGDPAMVEGYLILTKGSRKRRSLSGEDQLLLGIAAGMLGETGKARGLLSEASQHGPTAAAARANLGLVAMRLGATSEALEMFRSAQSLDPRNARLGHLIAEAALGARKYPLAFESYQKLVARDANDLVAQYKLGLVYLHGLKNFKEARKQFRIVLDHPKATRELRQLADGAFSGVRQEEEGLQGLASVK